VVNQQDSANKRPHLIVNWSFSFGGNFSAVPGCGSIGQTPKDYGDQQAVKNVSDIGDLRLVAGCQEW
jgi:hypothetical protein